MEPKQSTEPRQSTEPEDFIEPVRYDVSKYSPSILKPFERTAEQRIQQLEEYLTYDRHRHQLVSIRALIKLYEAKVINSFRGPPNGTCVYLCDGQNYGDRCPTDEERKGHAVWTELVNQQISLGSTYSTSAGIMHTFQAVLRLKPQDGLDAPDTPETQKVNRARRERDANYPSHVIQIVSDTGSNMLSVFRSDLEALNYKAYEPKREETITVTAAMGPVQRIKLTVQLRVLDNEGYGLTRWFDEEAIVIEDPIEGLERLSGSNIRKELYFATNRKHDLLMGVGGNGSKKFL